VPSVFEGEDGSRGQFLVDPADTTDLADTTTGVVDGGGQGWPGRANPSASPTRPVRALDGGPSAGHSETIVGDGAPADRSTVIADAYAHPTVVRLTALRHDPGPVSDLLPIAVAAGVTRGRPASTLRPSDLPAPARPVRADAPVSLTDAGAPAAAAATSAERNITIHIGRLDIRANLQALSPPRPEHRRDPEPEVGLSDYLRGRRDRR